MSVPEPWFVNPEQAPCGEPECGKDASTCDHVWCPDHQTWSRDIGGRLADCPRICPPVAA